MALRIYNSLTKQKEEFKPLKEGEVKMYVCGPTVYDEPHIGHLRSAYVFEVMRRYLQSKFCYKGEGYKVKFVRNVTDVDDKIIEKARSRNPNDLVEEVKKVSQEYYQLYKNDLIALGMRTSALDLEPKATEYIGVMVELIQKLLKNDFAYASQGDVYFNVNAFKDYGKLSHQKKDEMLESVRIDANEKKRNPLDFALWKEAKEGEPSWPGPLEGSKGRPGWHIECSAMSMKCLEAETFDIHGGGRDLIFPHHENEIAQSEAATSKPFARYWIHHGLITVNGQKMSKSLHNYITLKDLPGKMNEIKLLFLGTHYSAPLDYSSDHIKMETAVKRRFFNFFDDMRLLKDKFRPESNKELDEFEALFKDAMDDDFNTPQALTIMHEMLHFARKSLRASIQIATAEKLKKLGSVLGLFEDTDFYLQIKESWTELIDTKVEERRKAKQNKDFKKADKIRDDLIKDGIELLDHSDGTTAWRRKI